MMTLNYRDAGAECQTAACGSETACGGQSARLPSLGVPANETNRALLRFLRAAELAAWEDAEVTKL